MDKVNDNESGFSGIELVIVILVILVAALVGWLVYKDHHQNTTPTTNNILCNDTGSSPLNTNTDDQVNSFINAYKNGKYASLTVITLCTEDGQSIMDSDVINTLSTNHKTINNSEFDNFDPVPQGEKTVNYSCRLSIKGSRTAIVNCGNETFNLFTPS